MKTEAQYSTNRFDYSQELDKRVPLFVHDCTNAYLECALWADLDENEEPRTIYEALRETREQAGRDVVDFIKLCEDSQMDVTDFDAEDIGHNLWLSRCGHGTGFWDTVGRCDWSEEMGEKLHDIAKQFGQANVFACDDGKWMIE